LESSLVQVTKIQKGELKKEKARDFLNKLWSNSQTEF
jgi:hypothetical protein